VEYVKYLALRKFFWYSVDLLARTDFYPFFGEGFHIKIHVSALLFPSLFGLSGGFFTLNCIAQKIFVHFVTLQAFAYSNTMKPLSLRLSST
jgi:hypothetical protein